MTQRGHSAFVVLAIGALILSLQRPALAQRPQYVGGIPGATTGKVTAIVLGIAGVSAGITFGVYAAVKHNHVITGCTQSGDDGLQLTSDSDKQKFSLVGEVAAIKPGERVRVSGKKGKEESGGSPQFLVEKLSNDFGPCEVASATR
jgi:hypothetical protein